MMFRGILSLEELLKKVSENLDISNRKSKIDQIIQNINSKYQFQKPFQIEDKEGTLSPPLYGKVMEGMKDLYQQPEEEGIKNLSKALSFSMETDQALIDYIMEGQGSSDEIANLIASDLINAANAGEEKEIPGKDLTKSREWPHPVTEGSLKTSWIKLAEENKVPILEKIINFFKENPSPDDDEIHNFAESNKIEPDELEEEVYSLLGAFLGKGRSNLPENKDKEFDKDQTEKGIEVEQEHFEGADIPQEIIDLLSEKVNDDHLSEGPGFNKNYYNKLLDVEDELKSEE
jgi:hypothetical protein